MTHNLEVTYLVRTMAIIEEKVKEKKYILSSYNFACCLQVAHVNALTDNDSKWLCN